MTQGNGHIALSSTMFNINVTANIWTLDIDCATFTSKLQLFYGPLDFVWD